jgi:hypothetical protein
LFVAVHEPEPDGIVRITHESVRPVWFEQMVVVRADVGELCWVVGVAGEAARVEVVDLESAGLGAARDTAGEVAALDVQLDISG